ncbi:MAG: site-specific DNA-methyltransferase [Cyanobacteria bacterium REEB446]|nr:site-specific DNA-methyltransferase [Cyanobacteria bacterium REEB446]
MPELIWEGKDAVINYHHSLAVRELKIDQQDSLSPEPSLDDNLIIEGDNIEVLKSLIPKFASKVDVIYIDPPYNTGNENWVYNDNLNSPQIKSWLGNVVGKEDLQRHDKWLCMMYPRLVLARELLSESGVIFISINDVEFFHIKIMLDEIFDEDNYIETFTVRSNPRGNQAKKHTASEHEYILCFSKLKTNLLPFGFIKGIENYNKSDNQGKAYEERGLRKRGADSKRSDAPNQYFPIFYDAQNSEISTERKSNNAIEILPKLSNGEDGRWRWSKDTVNKEINKLIVRVVKNKSEKRFDVFEKIYFEENKISKIRSILSEKSFNYENATENLKEIFEQPVFNYSKPVYLLKHLLNSLADFDKDFLILDFFAGSGTTGHAVLEMNKEDGGSRKFILIQQPEESEEASKQGFKNIFEITTARIRRCIEGVATAKDPKLKEGLGGSFTVVKLGEALHLNTLFLEKDLPSYEALASYLFYHTTNQALSNVTENASHYIGKTENYKLYLIYSADKEKLKHHDYALSRSKLEQILKDCDNGYQALIYAVTIYVDNKSIKSLIEKEKYTKKPIICQIPYQYLQINSANVLNNLEDSED